VTPLADIGAEADRVLVAARAANVPVRLLGGLAVERKTAAGVPASLRRSSADIDLATPKGRGQGLSALLVSLGYAADAEFNALQGHRRMLFYDDTNARKADVFVDTFELCHSIPITRRIDADPDTIPLAELLLTKLQVVELNRKDLQDLLALLLSAPLTDDGSGIELPVIAGLLASDWGLWRTTQLTLGRIREGADGFELDAAQQQQALAACDTLWEAVEAAPKSRQWKLRSRIGDRKRWYEVPEEVS
jgi:hypothetical protein